MRKQIRSLLCLTASIVMLLSLCSCGKTEKNAKVEDGDKKVVLILVDGMRPDAMEQCGNSYFEELKKSCAYTLNAKTVYPSITLPAHLSLFYSIPPQKHGTLKNEFVPRKIGSLDDEGLFERLHTAGRKACMYYSWEPLRDVATPESLTASEMLRYQDFQEEDEDKLITERAIKGIKEIRPDFTFIYIGSTDSTGHDKGWMSEEYLERVNVALDCVKKIFDNTKDEYSIIITADHGGHGNNHGTDQDVDMTIPMFIYDKDFKPGEMSGEISILDIAPTIADIIDVKKPKSWEGKSLYTSEYLK